MQYRLYWVAKEALLHCKTACFATQKSHFHSVIRALLQSCIKTPVSGYLYKDIFRTSKFLGGFHKMPNCGKKFGQIRELKRAKLRKNNRPNSGIGSINYSFHLIKQGGNCKDDKKFLKCHISGQCRNSTPLTGLFSIPPKPRRHPVARGRCHARASTCNLRQVLL